MMNKEILKNYILSAAIFVVGVFSIPLANLFGGYYCSVLAISVVLTTILMYSILDKNTMQDNKILIISTLSLIAIEFALFTINDIFKISVYNKENINFIGYLAIGTQILSFCATIYIFVNFIIKMMNSYRNVNERARQIVNEETSVNDKEDQTIENISCDENDEKDDVENDAEIKKLSPIDIKEDVPFMEEELE